MKVNESSVLEKINRIIVTDRLNKIQILQLVKLASISNSIHELKDNMKWENYKQNIKKR